INLHTIRDDSLLGTLKFVSKTEDCQKYGALILDGMINDDIKFYTAYKTYLDYAIRKVPPKKARKFKKAASPKLKTVPASPKEPTQKESELKDLPKRPLLSQQPLLSSEILLVSCKDESDDVHDEDNNDDDDGNDDDSEKDKSNDEEKMYKEENDDVAKELYGDLNITQGLKDTDMTNDEQGGEDQ
nr:hypothetical protein [Tanacetum cinerariifolium]